MDYDFFAYTEMLYIIGDSLFVLTSANNRKVTLLCLLIKGIDQVLLCKLCSLHTMGHLMLVCKI